MMEQFGFRHRLVIASVSEQEFGNFSCVAENELGKSRGFIELSGEQCKNIQIEHLNFSNNSCRWKNVSFWNWCIIMEVKPSKK